MGRRQIVEEWGGWQAREEAPYTSAFRVSHKLSRTDGQQKSPKSFLPIELYMCKLEDSGACKPLTGLPTKQQPYNIPLCGGYLNYAFV